MKIRVYGDIHIYFDEREASRYDNELEYLKQTLYTDDIDLLVFAGDTIHKAYKISEDAVVKFFEFITDVIKICDERNIVFRLLKGTSTHDAKIIECVQYIYKDHKTFRAITLPELERLVIKGERLFIRWLPETYADKELKDKYINDLFNVVTDVTFFHGSVVSVTQGWDIETEPTMLPNAVIWDDELFLHKNKYFAAGGHIHSNITIKDKIFYTNSFSTHNFGDAPNTKGWIDFDISNGRFTYERKLNALAPNYYTTVINDIHTLSTEVVTDYIKDFYRKNCKNPADRLRVKIKGIAGENTNKNITAIQSLSRTMKIRVDSYINRSNTIDNIPIIENIYTDPRVPILTKLHKMYESKVGTSIDEIKLLEIITPQN